MQLVQQPTGSDYTGGRMNCKPIPEPNRDGIFRCSRCEQLLSNNPYSTPPRKNCPALTGNPIEPQPIPSGPGTELSKIIAEAGQFSFIGCECERLAAEMDAGREWCVEHREEIITHLVEQAAKQGLPDSLPSDIRLTDEEWRDGLWGMVLTACEIAESKE